MENYKYIGWVPCLSGKLYFKYISCGLGKDIVASINHKESITTNANTPDRQTGQMPYQRHIVLFSYVDWKDTRHESGDFHVVMLGKATHVSDFEGKIFIIHKNSINSQWEKIESDVKLLNKNVLKAYRNKEDIVISERYKTLESNISEFKSDYFYTVEYVVDRQGFTYLNYINEIDKIDDQEHMLTVVRQAFYYIKYAIHQHQHHRFDDDSLTTAHLAPESVADIGEQLIDDLKESMVAMKRDLQATRGHRLYDVKGVASYARSLLQSCCRMSYISKINYKHELEFIDNMKSSIETLVQNSERDISQNISASNAARSFILLFFAIAAPFVLLNKDKISENIEKINKPEFLPDTFLLVFEKFAGTTNGLLIFSATLFLAYAFYKSIICYKFGSILLFLKGGIRFFSSIADSLYRGYVLFIATLIIAIGFIAGALYLVLHS